jgi:hypothetical protein
MAQTSFVYSCAANDAAGLPLSVSIYADRGHVRDSMREDAEDAGFRVVDAGSLAALIEGEAKPLGEVVQLDCPVADAATLAALARIDMRAAHCGAQLIVSTTVAALDDVFACLDQSRPQILVDPRRADRVIALGQALARFPGLSVRELAEDDRLMLLRLTEQVGRIAERIDRLNRGSGLVGDVDGPGGDARSEDGAFRFESPNAAFNGPAFNGATTDASVRLVRQSRPPLPDPRLVRRIIRQRHVRGKFFDADLFADPAWDMLLDLTAARAEHARVSVTSLCIASGVPPTTALRWIGQMTEAGLFERVEDEADRRRAFIALTDGAADAMARYFAEIGRTAVQLT